MKIKNMALALAMTGFAVLAGCSTPSVINQRDGSSTVTSDKPEYDKKSGTYEYEKTAARYRSTRTT